jgi:hypothetical protein
MNIETLTYINLGLTGLLLAGLIVLIIKHLKTDRLRKEFFASGLKKDLEQILIDQNRGISQINKDLTALEASLSNLYTANVKNIQKIGFVKFNPFDNSGGNISFALAMLDATDNGVVISSLHGREGTRMYAKSVINAKSETMLTEEEAEAIKKAN